jgi:hypothetical protein
MNLSFRSADLKSSPISSRRIEARKKATITLYNAYNGLLLFALGSGLDGMGLSLGKSEDENVLARNGGHFWLGIGFAGIGTVLQDAV